MLLILWINFFSKIFKNEIEKSCKILEILLEKKIKSEQVKNNFSDATYKARHYWPTHLMFWQYYKI